MTHKELPDAWKNADGTLKTRWWFCTNDEEAEIIAATWDDRPRGYYEGGKWDTINSGRDSESELREKCGIPDWACHECGLIYSTSYFEPIKTQLLTRKLCFRCNHWTELLNCKEAIRVDVLENVPARGTCSERTRLDQLPRVAALSLKGWNTPRATDGENGGPNQSGGALPADAALGIASTSSHVETEKPGALNPAHSRWLMGFPVAWDSCGATAMRSSRNLRRNSSEPISKRREKI